MNALPAALREFSSLDELIIPEGFIADPEHKHYVDSDGTIHICVLQIEPEGDIVCPDCGKVSRPNGYLTKTCQILPIAGQTAYFHIRRRRYICTDDTCKASFVLSSKGFKMFQRRSNDLNTAILAISIFCSDAATAMICKALGIRIEHDSVNRLLSHIHIADNPDVETVGIDDVSLRKGQTYYTVVYDGNDHHLLALLEGRDGKSLKEWLRAHRKITMVARDRASAYASAIAEVLPECTQVADRFHLFQNLMEALKTIFKEELPANIYIKDGIILDEIPQKVSIPVEVRQDEAFQQLDYDNSVPLDEKGNPVSFIDKGARRDRKHYLKNEQSRIKKHQKIVAIREEYFSRASESHKENKVLKEELASKYQICIASVNKYLKMTDEEVEKTLEITAYKKRETAVNEYINIIFKMLVDGVPAKYIFVYVIDKGYSGSAASLRVHIESIAFNNGIRDLGRNEICPCKDFLPAGVIEISRNTVLRYMTCKDRKKMADSDISKYYQAIKSRFPIVETAEKAWNEFYDALMGNDPEAMDKFCDDYEESKFSGFVKGIKKDIAPIKNAISFDLNSGFVEGGNCKYKSVKRLMYGRAGHDHLFRKAYAQSIIARTGMEFEFLLHLWLDEPYQWKRKRRHQNDVF